jgi:hypothetical protein
MKKPWDSFTSGHIFFCKSKKNDNFVTSLDSPDSESAKDGVL